MPPKAGAHGWSSATRPDKCFQAKLRSPMMLRCPGAEPSQGKPMSEVPHRSGGSAPDLLRYDRPNLRQGLGRSSSYAPLAHMSGSEFQLTERPPGHGQPLCGKRLCHEKGGALCPDKYLATVYWRKTGVHALEPPSWSSTSLRTTVLQRSTRRSCCYRRQASLPGIRGDLCAAPAAVGKCREITHHAGCVFRHRVLVHPRCLRSTF